MDSCGIDPSHSRTQAGGISLDRLHSQVCGIGPSHSRSPAEGISLVCLRSQVCGIHSRGTS